MEIRITDYRVILYILVAILAIVAVISLSKWIHHCNNKRQEIYKEFEGISLFNTRFKPEEYFSFLNSCISYLLSYGYIDLKDFISPDVLKNYSSEHSYYALEEAINSYPIIVCKYEGNHKYVLNQDAMIDKYEEYQKATQEDNYLIPLFDMNLVNKHQKLFNFSLRYQQAKIIEKIMTDSPAEDEFELSELSLDRIEKNYSDIKEKELDIPIIDDMIVSVRCNR